jgi:DNA-binding NarL/FixJ family response regulator
MKDEISVFVVEPHPIFRRGLTECVRSLPGVARVADAATVDEAQANPGFADADLVLVDQDLPGASALLRAVSERSGADAIVLLARADGDVLEAAKAGAVGFLCKDTLTPDALAGAVHAATNGTSVIAPGLLAGLVRLQPNGNGAGETNGNGRASSLTAREQRVLSLIADGHPTREVAQRLCYSERTVKNVLHDVITKLGARSRSQAVAHAVRDGLI